MKNKPGPKDAFDACAAGANPVTGSGFVNDTGLDLTDTGYQHITDTGSGIEMYLRRTDGPSSRTRELSVLNASEVKPKKIHWLWPNRFPLGKVSTLAGDGGLGKSTVLIYQMARCSRGAKWPNNEGKAPLGSSIYLSAEDGVADTIVPRLMAAGADLNKINIVQGARDGNERSWFNLATDIEILERSAREIGDVVLIVIDPISSYLGNANSYVNAEVRGLLEPLGAMAERLNAAVICNNHHSKGGGSGAASRVIGSIAFVSHSRAVTQVFEDKDEPGTMLFLPSKTNLGEKPIGLKYTLFTTKLEGGIETAAVHWGGTVDITANEAMQAADEGLEGKSAKDEAIEFLKDELQNGPREVQDIKSRASQAGISDKSLRAARTSLGVIWEREKEFQGKYIYRLPS